MSNSHIKELLVDPEQAAQLKSESSSWKSWDLTSRQLSDLELMLNGALHPLQGYLDQADYISVCASLRAKDGTFLPIPIVLDVGEAFAEGLQTGQRVALRDYEGVMLAALEVGEIWKPDFKEEAVQVFGTDNPSHGGVSRFLKGTNPVYLGGKVLGIQLPQHYDFTSLRLTPNEVRQEFEQRGWRRVLGYHTERYVLCADHKLTFRAARELEANLLLHPVIDPDHPEDMDHYSRIRSYGKIMKHYPTHTTMLAALPLVKRLAGPRQVLLQALIRRNYGCTHFIVEPDQASPASRDDGKPFYTSDAAQQLAKEHEKELGLTIVPVETLSYVEDQDNYQSRSKIPASSRVLEIPPAELHEKLMRGRDIPEWFAFPEVVKEMRKAHPPRSKQGFTVFFTGLSGSGKSTIARVLMVRLMEMGGRPVTLLDGDIVRKNLSSELGFSREHRNLNILRIGFVASEITKNGGIALCAPIAPYDDIRKQVRKAVERGGGFLLAHVATPLEVCETRDRKGLYAKARAGILKEFTGISDPYEAPDDAEIVIDTTAMNPAEAMQSIIIHLEKLGFIDANGNG